VKSAWNFSPDWASRRGPAYYDSPDLENPKGWLEALNRTKGAMGIMYTAWQNRYELLAPFGDLVSGTKPPGQ
jgi:hypothetical protein